MQIKAALADPHFGVVAKAAAMCAERLSYDLEPDLVLAYQRFLDDPEKRDPNCIAKGAIARALVELQSSNVSFFIDGVHYRQMEPVWGGSVDTATDVRCSCAMGLVATNYPRALHELIVLLNDPESAPRMAAARAISCANPRQAELLLRLKVLMGDPEPEVVGECFTGLLEVEPDESLDFVAQYLDADESTRELAAIALGASRLDDALNFLKAAWDDAIDAPQFKRGLVRAAALHRSDDAFEWLLTIIEHSDHSLASDALEALATYKGNTRLANRVRQVLEQRNDRRLIERFKI